MNVENRLKKLEEAFAPLGKINVEIVDDGDDIVIISGDRVIKRTAIVEDREERDEH